MTLINYNQKRNFESTAEPKGKKEGSKSDLIFVIQKHAASRLHYDLRLELDGTLKSWAVPKGPSMNPADKRLAMMVEDHPYSYKDFEGTIPEGNYGAGNVIVWDNGTYTAMDSDNKQDEKKKLHAGLLKGHLAIELTGKKLKGKFDLVKLKGKQENAWLLIKKKDEYVIETDILKKNKSVITNVTLESMEKSSAKKVKDLKKKKRPVQKAKADDKVEFIAPMLAHTTENPFDDADWVFETKHDGYRIIAVINKDEVNLYSRNELPYDEKFKSIADELKKTEHTAVLDGEVVIEDSKGRSNFQLLQNYQKTGKGTLKYYVFDILNLNGNYTTGLSLLERKELLKIFLSKKQLTDIHYSEHVEEKGEAFFKRAAKKNLEGIIAKKSTSRYLTGKRSSDWLKIKLHQQEEAVIIGITSPQGSRNHFGALLLAQYDKKKLKHIGNCGTGFNEQTLKDLYLKFKPYFTDKSPIEEKLKIPSKIQWIKPKFTAQVKFTEMTQDGHLRHPVFLGLREDKNIKDITSSSENKTKPSKQANKNSDDDFDLKIGKNILHLTNQNKIYFPNDGITKGDVVNYYKEVADVMLPYLKNRPQSMNRFPNGITESSFYQKDVDTKKIPDWLKTEKLYSKYNKNYIDYLICNDKATLLYMVNLGCIEINPWNSTILRVDNPDWIVIDIDPAKDDFKEVVKTALVVKEVMDELETECYCKTSGATGLHVYIPLAAKYNYDTAKLFAELIANAVTARLPETTTVIRNIQKRDQKIYIDFLQNRKGQTLAAPYSVRPKPGATVSTPLEWKEVDAKLHPSQFTTKNMLKRLDKKGDLWQPVLGKGANIDKLLQKMAADKEIQLIEKMEVLA